MATIDNILKSIKYSKDNAQKDIRIAIYCITIYHHKMLAEFPGRGICLFSFRDMNAVRSVHHLVSSGSTLTSKESIIPAVAFVTEPDAIKSLLDTKLLRERFKSFDDSTMIFLMLRISTTKNLREATLITKSEDVWGGRESPVQGITYLNFDSYCGHSLLSKQLSKCGNENCAHQYEKLSFCSSCGKVMYCCKECQLSDWKFHKPVCRQIVQARKNH